MNKILKLAIASDHAGFKLKEAIRKHVLHNGHYVKDFGTNSEDSVDYPDFAHPLAKEVEEKKYDLGIIMCGTGNGINMAANKHKNIRAALCWNTEIAKLARQHNNANILSLPARFISDEEAFNIVDAFLSTDFEGGRHERRVEKI